jgi:hypothetical protein
MANNWNYNPGDYKEKDFELIPSGDYRVRISDVTEKIFSSGNEGYEIVFDVNGFSSKLWFYIVLMPDNPSQTNNRLGTFFNSFNITNTTLGDGKQWIGKAGAVRVKHEEYNGNMQAKVSYLIDHKKQESLPAWADSSGFTEVNNIDDLPFLPD